MACFERKYAEELVKNAAYIGAPGKSLFAVGGYPSTPATNTYRDVLFRDPTTLQNLSGIILPEETLYNEIVDGKPIFDVMNANDVLIGIRVGEDTTTQQCLDGLGSRCAAKYYEAGARFATWRAGLPRDEASELSIHQNLARYAAICQENGLVPIVSPEFFGDGSYDHAMSAAAAERVSAACYKALSDHNVMLDGIFMKPIMTPGWSVADVTRFLVSGGHPDSFQMNDDGEKIVK